ncbi:MAG: DUF4147 domain-containing protein, partial [Vicinamibacterales bacterium]
MDAVEPSRLVRHALGTIDLSSSDAPAVVAVGKAAEAMFWATAESRDVGPSMVASSSFITTTARPGIELFRAGHPAPNASSAAAAERALALARTVAQSGELLVLLSGGASAMLVAPVGGVTLDDKLLTARRLMAAGAPIDELNCVRKHLSRIKGG